MKDRIALALGRALEQTRAGHPGEATRIIQAALAGGTFVSGETEPHAVRRVPSTHRRPLGQVVDTLVNGRRMRRGAQARAGVAPAVPVGARYETRQHDCAHGHRDYRLFVPSPRQEPVQGLVLMLHGCTQTSDDFAAGTGMNLLGERHNLLVVYPEQARTANQMACWNWFRPEDQRHGSGEPAFLADLATHLSDEFGTAEGAVFAAGLSAGGAMAAILGAEYPHVFSGIGVHSGLAPGAARDVATAYAAMRGQSFVDRRATGCGAPVIVFHGDADTTVAPSNADAVVRDAVGDVATSVLEDAATVGAVCTIHRDTAGRTLAEDWRIPGMGHAWSGGSAEGSYTHPEGPDASAEMIRFFLENKKEDRP